MSRHSDLADFYGILHGLANSVNGLRTLSELSQFKDWPERGVYFFFDQAESRSDSGSGLRLVRVGTHALKSGSKSTLRQRLAQHRGNLSGGGNHRGSIFRLLIGQALLESETRFNCESWGVKSDKGAASRYLAKSRQELGVAESPIECGVSEYINRLPFVCLNVPDEPSPDSLRGFIERNSIALLSNYGREPLDSASVSWLGHHSNRILVRESGLWNQNHVTETHDPAFLSTLEDLVENQVHAR
jgi:hypothetical protein